MARQLVVFATAAGLLLPAAVTPSPAAAATTATRTSAQPVVDWSTEAQTAIVDEAGIYPGEAALLMGIVQVAIYDAVVGIAGGAQPYAVRPRVPAGASVKAATAAAAHRVLVGLLPDQQPRLDAIYAAYLATIPGARARAGGMAVGEEVGTKILALRANDGRDDVVPYVQPPLGPGVFQPTAPFPPIGTNLGRMKPLTLPRPDIFRPGGPPALSSDRYARDLNEVAARGGRPATYNAQELATARLWTDHGIPQWNRVLFRLIDERHLDAVEAARLLAMAHASGGDAMIACFEAKYHYMFWRPIQAIRRADTDGNPATVAIPGWTPVLPTPNHPEYPAAHNCHSTAVLTAIAEFFGGDRVPITVDSEATGQVRRFDRLSEAAADVMEARILAGLHFRFSTEDGAELGALVARYATMTHFKKTNR